MKDSLAQLASGIEASLTLSEAQEKFLQDRLIGRGFAAKTQRNYQIDVGQLCDFLQATCDITTVQQVRLRHLESYLSHLEQQGLTSATRRRKVAAIRSFFRFLQEDGHRAGNPAENLLPPERVDRQLRYLTEREYRRLLAVVGHDVRDAAIVQLYLQTGMRLSELARLRLTDVVLPAGQETTGRAHIRGRGRKDRTIRLNWKACEALAAYLAVRPADAADATVFISRLRRGIGPRGIERLVAKYLTSAGISNA
jgi:site-specific recombinase XerD